MSARVWMASLVFAGTMAGCRTPEKEAITAISPTIPTANPTATTPPPPTQPPTSTPQPAKVFASANDQLVNCRFGPGTIYEVISALDANQSSRADGRDYTNGWLHIHDPLNPGGYCWVSQSAVEVEGEAAALPVHDPPLVTVNKLAVRVEPQRVTVTCENFPQFVLFIAEVTTNGPSIVNWRWEISTGEVSEPATLIFEEADTKVLQLGYVIHSPNDYWVRLHVNAPNETEEQANFIANCTP